MVGFQIKGISTFSSAVRHLVNESKFLNLGNVLYYVRARTGKETSSFSPTIASYPFLVSHSFSEVQGGYRKLFPPEIRTQPIGLVTMAMKVSLKCQLIRQYRNDTEKTLFLMISS